MLSPRLGVLSLSLSLPPSLLLLLLVLFSRCASSTPARWKGEVIRLSPDICRGCSFFSFLFSFCYNDLSLLGWVRRRRKHQVVVWARFIRRRRGQCPLYSFVTLRADEPCHVTNAKILREFHLVVDSIDAIIAWNYTPAQGGLVTYATYGNYLKMWCDFYELLYITLYGCMYIFII